MLKLAQVNGVVKKAASAALKRQAGVRNIISEAALDSEGHEALHITVVLKRGEADKITGDTALDTLVGIEKALRDASENRLPIVFFAGEEELEADGDAES